MPSGRQGSIRLFQIAGIDVFLHWSWFLIAVLEINWRSGSYSSVTWNVLEYLALFLIVLMHEFGHALACRQVGGIADHIVLWPLGGVAYVNPPQRPGPTLWSLAAGPLVNVALWPVLAVLTAASVSWDPNIHQLIDSVSFINKVLLGFNILPIYPLDGGQILRSLLWFPLGRARSLLIATIFGFVGIAAFFALAIWMRSMWLIAMGIFMLLNCWAGMKQSLALMKLAKIPRRQEFVCPHCKSSPPIGNYWRCANCGVGFDTFASGATCPQCKTQFPQTVCLDCRRAAPISDWNAVVYSGTQPENAWSK
jgi:Zn-dependent protease